MANPEKVVSLYTDGACSGNQNETNLGGYGAVLEYGNHTREIFGGEANTTNNRMEMTALIKALEALNREGLSVRVFSDSSYLINCFRQRWHETWQANGWKTAGKKPVENVDLWQRLLTLTEKHRIRYFRVRGHINPGSKKTDMDAHYARFLEVNGACFSPEEFLHIVEKNNRADALANLGIDSLREKQAAILSSSGQQSGPPEAF